MKRHREDPLGKALTTNQGVRLENDQDTLTAGDRGPSLLEDFHFREKITHFDHERIPERAGTTPKSSRKPMSKASDGRENGRRRSS